MEQEKDSEGTSLFAATFDHPGRDAPAPAEAGQPEAEAQEQPPVETGEEAPPATDQPRDEAGRFASKAEPEAAPPAAEKEPPHVPRAALVDERGKRQTAEQRATAAEQKVAQYEAYLAQMQRQGQPPAQQQPAEKPDPVGALLDDPSRFVGQVVQQAVAPVQEAMVQQRLALSRQFVASQASDYEEAEATFSAHVQANPQFQAAVAQQLRTHPNPAAWVLEQGRSLKQLAEFQQWRQQRGQPPADPPPSAPASSLPASLATARGVGASRPTNASAAGSPLDGIWRD
jgi:hypothetical protein